MLNLLLSFFKVEWIIHSIYGVKRFHSLSEFHSILTPVEWKFITQRVKSRPVHSIFTPKVITEVTTQGVKIKWIQWFFFFNNIETESCGMPWSPTSPDMALKERERDMYWSRPNGCIYQGNFPNHSSIILLRGSKNVPLIQHQFCHNINWHPFVGVYQH